MRKKDAQQAIQEAINWLPEDSVGRIILKSFELDEHNGEAFASPIPFGKFTSQADWKLSGDNAAVSARIRYIQEMMDTREFPLRTSMYLTHEKEYCVLVLGTEQVRVIRERKRQGGLSSVTLSFDGMCKKDDLPSVVKGDPVNISASSPIRGWLYLFSVDADRVITPVYPGEGKSSNILLSQNTHTNIAEKINFERQRYAQYEKPQPLRYCGDSEGLERVVALVIESDEPVPVTISHLRSRFPLPLLFSHEQRHKGMGYSPTDSDNDFASISLEKIAIGTLDYYYEG